MIELPRSFVDEMIEQARDEFPNEACGLIAADGGSPVRVFRMRNADESPVTYRLDPREQLQVFNELDDRGWELYAIYHSHTASPAYPSPTDVRLAFYPEARYLLISLAEEEPVVRGYRILDGDITEEEVRVSA
jgi:proteasome lid subunit RPN8/RPN11